jgi:hypothetical protein
MYAYLKRLYLRLPPSLQRITSPAVDWAYALRRLLDLRPTLWCVEGRERSSGLQLSVVSTAHDPHMLHFLYLIFGPEYSARHIGKAWRWRLRTTIRTLAPDSAICIASAHRRLSDLTEGPSSFYIPYYVSGHTCLPVSQLVLNGASVKRYLREIRKNDLKVEITQDTQLLDHFYHSMYEPYAAQMYGSRSVALDYSHLKLVYVNSSQTHWELFLVRKGQEYLAGLLTKRTGATGALGFLGVLGGDRNAAPKGAIPALYHVALQRFTTLGLGKCDFGCTRPFLRDGVLEFKRRWGHQISGALSAGISLVVLKNTPAVRSFLDQNPFIIESAGERCGVIFLSQETEVTAEKLAELEASWFYPGLAKLLVYALPEGSTAPTLLQTIARKYKPDISTTVAVGGRG